MEVTLAGVRSAEEGSPNVLIGRHAPRLRGKALADFAKAHRNPEPDFLLRLTSGSFRSGAKIQGASPSQASTHVALTVGEGGRERGRGWEAVSGSAASRTFGLFARLAPAGHLPGKTKSKKGPDCVKASSH